MAIYKKLSPSDFSTHRFLVNKTVNLTTSSAGLTSNQFRSGSTLFRSGSHWQFLNANLFLSHSKIAESSSRLQNPYYSLGYDNPRFPQFKSKFNDSGSILSIPQFYFGERIQRGTFELTDITNNVIIKDDKHGNIYSTNATVSKSVGSVSSSKNYVGNILYEQGLAVLTETSSFSHTPSTASIEVKTLISGPSTNHFFITGSDLSTSIKFIATGSTETDTTTTKFFASASTTATTALSASKKVNEVFALNHISSSVSASVIQFTNSANLLKTRKPSTTLDNLQPISGAGAFTTSSGFGGGVAEVNYGKTFNKNFKVSFKSTHTIYIQEYNVKIDASSLNGTSNVTAIQNMNTGQAINNITGSDWSPFITTVGLYDDDSNLIAYGRLSQPIKTIDWGDLNIKIMFDML